MTSRFQISYDLDPPPRHVVDAGLHLAARYETLATLGGYGQSIRAVDLPDGWMAYIVNLPHSKTVHFVGENIEAVTRPREEEYVKPSTSVVPVIYHYTGISTDQALVTASSAAVRKAGYGADFSDFTSLNPSTTYFIDNDQMAVFSYELSNAKPYSDVACFKLGVPVDEAIRKVSSDSSKFQGYRCDPGRYTGMLPMVIQLLLGVGRILPSEVDGGKTDIEYVKDSRAAGLTDNDLRSYGSITLSKDVASGLSMSLKYDYRWGRTHGIVWARRTPKANAPFIQSADPERIWEPFLCEIGTRGILLMPLPRDGASFDPAVREVYLSLNPTLRNILSLAADVTPEYMDQTLKDLATRYVSAQQSLIDSDKADVFSIFGGFPIDECFPQDSSELDRLIRSGVVIRLGFPGEFYSLNAISPDHGWAFTKFTSLMDYRFPAGNSLATNVCYSTAYNGDIRYSYAYVLSFDISQIARSYNTLYKDIIQLFGLTRFVDIYKATLLSEDQAIQLMAYGTYEDFLNMQCAPEWVASVGYSIEDYDYAGNVTYADYVSEVCSGYCLLEYPFNNVPLQNYGAVIDVEDPWYHPTYYSSVMYKAWNSITDGYVVFDTSPGNTNPYNVFKNVVNCFSLAPYKSFFVYDTYSCFGRAQFREDYTRPEYCYTPYWEQREFFIKYSIGSSKIVFLRGGCHYDFNYQDYTTSVENYTYYHLFDKSTTYVSQKYGFTWSPDNNLATDFLNTIFILYKDWIDQGSYLEGTDGGGYVATVFYSIFDISNSRSGIVAMSFLNRGYGVEEGYREVAYIAGFDIYYGESRTLLDPQLIAPGGCANGNGDFYVGINCSACFTQGTIESSGILKQLISLSGGTYNEVLHVAAYCQETSYDNFLLFIAKQDDALIDVVIPDRYEQLDCYIIKYVNPIRKNPAFSASSHLSNSMWPLLADYTNPFRSPEPFTVLKNNCGGFEDTYVFSGLPDTPESIGTLSYGELYHYIVPLVTSGWYQTKPLVESGKIVSGSVCFGCFPSIAQGD